MNTATVLEYGWPFYNIMHERVKNSCSSIARIRTENNVGTLYFYQVFKLLTRIRLKKNSIATIFQ